MNQSDYRLRLPLIETLMRIRPPKLWPCATHFDPLLTFGESFDADCSDCYANFVWFRDEVREWCIDFEAKQGFEEIEAMLAKIAEEPDRYLNDNQEEDELDV